MIMIINEYIEYMKKYKEQYGDKCIVLLQVGSFYEMYTICENNNNDNDIYKIADICGIQTTKKNKSIPEISLNNPEAAVAYKSAGTPVEKQSALATAKEAAQKEASISKSVLDFSELDAAKRDAKAVTSFFKDLAGQLDNEKVDVSSLNGGNFNDFLK